MRDTPHPPPPGWQMELFEVIPGLFIGTRLDPASDFGSLGVDVIVDLEDWGWAWVPPVPTGAMYLSYPMEDEDDVDPKVREVASFVASLVGSGRRVLVHCTEGLNRSGVVVARALMTIGRTADEAIQLVRERRGPSVDGFPALGNTAFVDWLRTEDARSERGASDAQDDR
ncbi:MAG TPA: dual specificity protein phosphatase family protein [Actinomycetota bacterium]|nr:dual specificity protein phosphatase family protein [Actinomycetota bacterium]